MTMFKKTLFFLQYNHIIFHNSSRDLSLDPLTLQDNLVPDQISCPVVESGEYGTNQPNTSVV